MKVLAYITAILCIMALMMPWCWGYLQEASRPEMAEAAKSFGWGTGMLAVLTCFGMFAMNDLNK